MSIDNIIFEQEDTVQETAVKTCLLYAGTTELTNQLKKIGITHTKVNRGAKTIFVLRGAKIGRLEVIL